MRNGNKIVLVLLVSVLVCLLAALAQAEGKYKLKSGAAGDLCLDCHSDFTAKMQAKYIHTPLAAGDCTGCHNPHASDHGMLLEGDADSICLTCHDNPIPQGAVSQHKVVAEGRCVACHDPHSSANPANLIKRGDELCFSCHEDLGKKVAANKYAHAPVEDDCLTCHDPHAGAENPALLRTAEPALCLDCHSTNGATFKKKHMNYPVEQGRCTTCHDPHGSNSGAILGDYVHDPVANAMCSQCHNAADSSQPFALKTNGYELCQGCHYDMVNEAFARDRMHWPMVDKTGCVNCHNPHASSEPALLLEPQKQLCGSCHQDTIARQERARTRHQPVDDGDCTICHAPHSSDNLFLQQEASTIDTCAQCHDWQTHSTHPIGDKVVDPRNPNVTLDCLSCHRTHGTEYEHFIYYPDVQALCVQCHTKYRR
ncbi:MAG: cytochrome C [Desulfuromonas sp.]|nr:MAG: cytochrome C [Desulfuromonas sp.]